MKKPENEETSGCQRGGVYSTVIQLYIFSMYICVSVCVYIYILFQILFPYQICLLKRAPGLGLLYLHPICSVISSSLLALNTCVPDASCISLSCPDNSLAQTFLFASTGEV